MYFPSFVPVKFYLITCLPSTVISYITVNKPTLSLSHMRKHAGEKPQVLSVCLLPHRN